jgi:hypothetical protein
MPLTMNLVMRQLCGAQLQRAVNIHTCKDNEMMRRIHQFNLGIVRLALFNKSLPHFAVLLL